MDGSPRFLHLAWNHCHELLWSSPVVCFRNCHFVLRRLALLLLIVFACCAHSSAHAKDILVEAEGFVDHGGWQLDTQFVDSMGSPYLLAHGLGQPVEDAVTKITVTEPGQYQVYVRTFDWVARWNAQGSPGRFQLVFDGTPHTTTFGTTGKQWGWQPGGTVELKQGEVELRLHDLTGFDGRCDAIFLTQNPNATPPNTNDVLPKWRLQALGLPEEPAEVGPYDLVVVGGGYSGMGAAISAARQG